MTKTHINLTTYDDFEKLDSFAGGLENYRKSKLKSAGGHVGFIKKLFPKKKITVLELGSGNSKTLFALEKAGVLQKGYGVEISKSRYDFAELWKKEWGFKCVENRNEDVLGMNMNNFEHIDLCFCVDLALQFFEPIEKGSVLRILKDVYKKTKAGGKIIIEVDGLERVMGRLRNNKIKLWEEFPSSDPWRYSLWDCTFNPKNKFLDFKKTFIKRDEFGFSENRMVIRVYTKGDMQQLLRKAGFSKINFYADWKEKKFQDDKGEYIAVGTK